MSRYSSRYKKRNRRKKRIPTASIVILIVAAVLCAVVLIVLPKMLNQSGSKDESAGYTEGMNPDDTNPDGTNSDEANSEGENSEAANAAENSAASGDSETAEAENLITFPLQLQDGMLEVTSAFLYDGLNPDCENQEGSNIAAITVKNISDTYLANAEITLTTTDGEAIVYTAQDLPAGTTAMVFAKENVSIANDTGYIDAACEASYDEDASLNEDSVSATVEGALITLQNNTDSDIAELVVYCHSILDEQYFGGITYTYTITDLPAYGTTSLEATDCILGFAEVVRVVIK